MRTSWDNSGWVGCMGVPFQSLSLWRLDFSPSDMEALQRHCSWHK